MLFRTRSCSPSDHLIGAAGTISRGRAAEPDAAHIDDDEAALERECSLSVIDKQVRCRKYVDIMFTMKGGRHTRRRWAMLNRTTAIIGMGCVKCGPTIFNSN